MVTWSKDVFSGLGGAVSGIFGGIAGGQQAKGYKAAEAGYLNAAQRSRENAFLSAEGTSIKQLQASREIFRVLGGIRSDVAGAGLKQMGSAGDILRSSASEAALTRQLLGLQGSIEQRGYEQEAESYQAMAASAATSASASKSSGIGSTIGGLISGGAALFSLFSDERLKENVELVYRREDGIGIYRFNYRGSDVRFEGVLAQEVASIRPEAVDQDADGFYKVDYDMINVVPREVED